MSRRRVMWLAVMLGILALSLIAWTAQPGAAPAASTVASARAELGHVSSQEREACIACHQSVTPGAVKDWQDSKHSSSGIDCYTCHNATGKDRSDAVDHNGFKISVLVTPMDCQQCHATEAGEFLASRHADAASFIGSLDNILGEIIGGGPAANTGCKQCHGSTIATTQNGVLDAATWPNTGIGRLNPDGSKGTCTACHSRHLFSVAQARQPEICGKCHLGPDHPQMEVWQESKHGIRYYEAVQSGQSLNINNPAGEWQPGRDYSAGPTCASCHMSATPNQRVTHDVGKRISWTLRPVVSTKLPEADTRRAAMQDVCAQCHSASFTKGFYNQFDSLVDLYNSKYATPAKTIIDELTATSKLTNQPFDAEIKWTYYELWHHEGRRARHGASMAAPDYTWWHGLYEVSKVFYTEFIPQARELDPQLVDNTLNSMNEHDWFTKGLGKDEVANILNFYQARYGE